MGCRRSVAVVTGPLAGYAGGFRAWLAGQGYELSTVEEHAFLMGHLSRWLTRQRLTPSEFVGDVIDRYLVERRATRSHLSGSRALDQLLGFLRRRGVVPVARDDSSVERLIDEYRRYLRSERGLVDGSIVLRVRTARLFLGGLPELSEALLRSLLPADVSRFVIAQCGEGRRGVAWAKTLVSGMRSLLVFLHVTGRVSVSLAAAVPTAAGWRLSSLPRGLEAEHVARVLESCDRQTLVGRRDFAILMLLARLGLRACEVARLTLDDVDWRGGELIVHGKGGEIDCLPLPHYVGEALVAHLLGAKRDETGRALFVRVFAPHGPITPRTIDAILRHACDRAGVARVGTHRLRHTVATDLLAAGAGLSEIAAILRHANLSSTAIYAKVDRTALRALARPWPLEAIAS